MARKKRYRWKSAQNRYSVMQIMAAKSTTLWTLYVHAVLNCAVFSEIFYIILYARVFLPFKFFSSIILVNYASSYRKM